MTDLKEAWEHFTDLRARESAGAVDQGDLAAAEQEAFVAVLGGVLRQRDEAREVVRAVLGHMEAGDLESNEMDPAAMPAIAALENLMLALLEGVERTHTLVPVDDLLLLANAADTYSYRCEGETQRRWRQRAAAAHAAARGGHVEWPS